VHRHTAEYDAQKRTQAHGPHGCEKSGIIIDQLFINKLCGRPPQYAPVHLQVDLGPSDVESGVRVTCDVHGLPLCQF